MLLNIMFVLVQSGDALTMLMLPPGAELNPLAAASPIGAFIIKILVMGMILIAPFEKYRDEVLLIGTVVGAIGLGSNLSVLL